MGYQVRINGVLTDVGGFNASEEERTIAMRRHHARQEATFYSAPGCGVNGGTMSIGTPRHRKHKGDNIAGVRFK